MTSKLLLVAASAITLSLGTGSAMAQSNLVGTRALEDRIEAVEDAVQDDFEDADDAARFGNPQFAPGLTTSIAMTFAGRTGNTDTQDLAAAGRMRYNVGQWSHTLGFGLEFGESNKVKNKENVFAVYDANYYINDQFYVFGLGRVERDEFPQRKEAFFGVGPGVRIINNQTTAWRVQAGPGVRYQKLGAGPSTTEAAAIASSRLYHKFTDTIFMTNDTDLLNSKAGLLATNDFGVSFKMTEGLATRVSYRTEYNNNPAPGTKKSDNTLGVSLVLSF
ncbi:MAG: DUF481 domain-containing protein [Gemmobacter sp.]|nr:DUF481 domain-containing protein [Gemmobacter sp.]